MVSKVTYTDITNKQTNGESGAALVNDTKRAINEVIDLVGDIDLGGVGGSTLPVFQPRQLGDGVKTTFNTPATGSQGAKAQHFDVYLNYVYQRPELDFSIDGATGDLTFLDNASPYAPNLNDTIDIKYVKPYTFDTSSDTPVEGTGTGVTKSIGDWFGEAGPAKVTATGTTTPRSLADRFSRNLHLRDFGAVGDGVTDDTTGLIKAIVFSINNGVSIEGGNLTYLVTGNLPNIHDARLPNTKILRGTNSFHTSNTSSHLNTIYVSTSGSASNDGLTATLPMASANQAFSVLDKYEVILDGLWAVEFAAGTYDQTTQATLRAKSKNRIKIYGPNVGHPNTPTAIFTGLGSGDDYTVGWYQTGEGTLIDVSDVKFLDFTGDPSGRTRGALICDQGGNIVTHNVHAQNCSWYGIYISFMSRARIRGGILDNCREALNTNNSQVSVASTGDLSGGTIFRNSTEKAVYWSRSTQGHLDDCTLEDNVTGIVVAEGSRVDSVRNNFKRNGTAVSCTSGGMYGENPNAPSNFNSGTADANGIAVRNTSNGLDYNGLGGGFATNILRVNSGRLELTPTATTNKQVLSTLWTMPAPWLDDIYKEIRIKAYLRVTSLLVAAATIQIDLGTTQAIDIVLPSTAVGVYVLDVQIHSNGVGAQKSYGTIIGPSGTTRTTNDSSSADTTTATGVNIAMTLADVSDQPKIKIVRSTTDALG